MPILSSSYKNPPFYQFNGHLQTIIPGVFRKVKGVHYERERLELADGDFLDLDWVFSKSKNLVLLSHGLEGSSDRQYIRGAAKIFAQQGWDVLAWNCRSCSGEMNRTARLYHHGDVEDIGTVIHHAMAKNNYKNIVMVGFSMGGAMSLNYLGKNGKNIPASIRGAIAFSTPCDLKEGAEILNIRSNAIYRNRFLRKLKVKIFHIAKNYPDIIDVQKLEEVKVWKDFDEYFSAPLNNYKSADDFYYNSSAKNFMENIQVPTLLVNALNDPILTEGCSPKHIAKSNPNIFIENPAQGGHVGFMVANEEFAWSEKRALEFANELL
ncbi:MAG: alpha/beta fold hydrolase [Bacteroidota bacterium]